MDKQIKARTKWVNLYLETKDTGYVCRKCGISRPTLRKWYRRYQQDGLRGLVGQSKRPHSSPNKKINEQYTTWVIDLREHRNLGARCIQTDRGLEFFAEKVQQKLMSLSIKFRPNKPGSQHLNGKVERSQKTDLEEFYAITDLSDFEKLREELSQWQFFYNWQRPHGSLGGKTPSQIVGDLGEKTPLSDTVLENYNVKNERIQIANYQMDLAIRKLKGSL